MRAMRRTGSVSSDVMSVVTRFDGHMFKLGDGREAIILFEHGAVLFHLA